MSARLGFRVHAMAWGEETLAAQTSLVSNVFRTFMQEAPRQAQPWSACVQGLASASALDAKTGALAYVAVLAALRLESGIPFDACAAKKAGASREDDQR